MKEDTVEKALLFGLRPSHGTYPTRQLLGGALDPAKASGDRLGRDAAREVDREHAR